MNNNRINRITSVFMCALMSVYMVSCGTNDTGSSFSENEIQVDTTQTAVALTTAALTTTITTTETTATEETTVTTIELGDYGISLSEYREQKEQARLEELNSKEQIGDIVINTKTEPLNMRQFPDTESEVLEEIPKGTVVPYYEIEGEWFLVQYNGKKGYVHQKYVLKKEDVGLYSSAYIGEVKINTKKDPLNLRESPDKESKSLDKIPKGTIIPYLNTVGDWVYVEYHGKLGYIHSQYVIFNP